MSDAPNQPETTTETTTQEVTPETTETKAPKWDGDFDPDRAARLVENLRAENKTTKDALTAVQSKLAEYEQDKMSETEKLTHRAETAEKERDKLARDLMVSNAARTFGLSDDLAQFLSGSTPEEVESQAKLLSERMQPAKPAPPTKPQTKLVNGSGVEVDENSQLTREDLQNMSAVDINKARKAGRLKNILQGS